MVLFNVCPTCKSESLKTILSATDFLVTNETFHIQVCLTCGFKFTNPRPSEGEISSYYDSNDYISHSGTSQGLINKLYKIVRKYTLSQKTRFVNSLISKGSILDIGCGTGDFLYEMHKLNFNVTGIEPNISARKTAVDKFKLSVLDEKEIYNLKNLSFNVITLWHVLEHVYNLDERLLQIYRVLKSDGILLIAIPNIDSFDAKHYSKYWAALDVPRHLYHFNPSTLIKLLKQFGFSHIKTKPMLFDAFYISILSEKYRKRKFNFIIGLYYGFLSNLSAIFSKNYSSNVFVFKKE